jgi:hypothetical protein
VIEVADADRVGAAGATTELLCVEPTDGKIVPFAKVTWAVAVMEVYTVPGVSPPKVASLVVRPLSVEGTTEIPLRLYT